jgi:hypothetical protein
MKIINFGQVVSLEHGTQLTFQLTVDLPSGRRIQVKTDEGTVDQLMDALLGNGGQHPHVERKTADQMLKNDIAIDSELLAEESYSGSVDDFGGDYDPGELINVERSPDAVMGALSEIPVVRDSSVRGGLGQPKRRDPQIDSDGFLLPVRSRTVPKDEMGYPIVQRRATPSIIPDDDGEGDGTQI